MKQISKNNHGNRNRQKNRRNNNNGGGSSNGGNNLNRVYESSGPEGKVRGNPQQIIDKYNTLAQDAMTSGDRITAESFFQHAEHYQRIVSVAMAAEAEAQARRAEQQAILQQQREERDREREQYRAERDRDRGPREDHTGGDTDNRPQSHNPERSAPDQAASDPAPLSVNGAEQTDAQLDAPADDAQRHNPLAGDPRPDDAEKADASDEQPELAEAAAPKPVKKRVSRAKPKPAPEAADGEEAPKPKRGRPRKKVEPEVAAEAVPSAPQEVPTESDPA